MQKQNLVVLDGRVSCEPQTRYSVSGVPITRFELDHASQQTEAGHPRETKCRIGVVIAGQALQPSIAAMKTGSLVKVQGFLSSAGYRAGEYRLVLHAQRIEPLPAEAAK